MTIYISFASTTVIFQDTFNGRKETTRAGIEYNSGPITKPSDPKLQPIIDMVKFFSTWNWNLANHSGLDSNERTLAFLPRECWNDLQQACLGFVGLCRYWTNIGVTVYGRTCSQDVVEHHFVRTFTFVLMPKACPFMHEIMWKQIADFRKRSCSPRQIQLGTFCLL
jgi:hypothetical protein